MPLDDATLQRLLTKQVERNRPSFAPQAGPLRYIDNPRRCTQRGCGSMGYYTVQGAPKCTVHALSELNEMLISAGFRGVTTSHCARPTTKPPHRVCNATVQYKLDIGMALHKFECIHGISLDKECNGCESE